MDVACRLYQWRARHLHTKKAHCISAPKFICDGKGIQVSPYQRGDLEGNVYISGAHATSTRKKGALHKCAKIRVEVAGVEPASKQGTQKLSTRLVTVSSFSAYPAGNSLTCGPASKI